MILGTAIHYRILDIMGENVWDVVRHHITKNVDNTTQRIVSADTWNPVRDLTWPLTGGKRII